MKYSVKHIPFLDGLRAVAISLVILCHLRFSVSFHCPDKLLSVWGDYGPLGVQIFFGLSGYLITKLLVWEKEQSGQVSLGNFYIRRALRIFPAFYMYFFIIFLMVYFNVLKISYKALLSSAIYLKNYISSCGGSDSWFIGHTCSLAVEEQFYLFWPILFVFLGIRRAKYAALAIIVMMPVIRLASWILFPDSRDSIGGTIHTCADRLMFGCLLALLDGNSKFEKIMANLRSGLLPLLAAIILFLVSPCLRLIFHSSYYLIIGLSLEGVSIAFIIAWLLRSHANSIADLLNSTPMIHIGRLSYSLYLWQQLFLTGNNKTFTGIFPLNILFSYIMACASYYLLEKRFLALRARFR